jgi:hypothetical protein
MAVCGGKYCILLYLEQRRWIGNYIVFRTHAVIKSGISLKLYYHNQVGDHGEGKTVAMMEVKKGWKWSEHMKPIVKTDSCQKVRYLLIKI